MVTKMAAQVDGTPCCTFIGPGGAGHYVKMVHNGIEYADMQLITEAYDLFKTVYGLDAAAAIGGHLRAVEVERPRFSYLIDITAAVLHKTDASTGGALVDSHRGRGRAEGHRALDGANALELGVPLTGITEAVFARAVSGQRKLRSTPRKALPHAARPRPKRPEAGRHRRHPGRALRLEDRRLCAGLRADDGGLGTEYGWDLKLGEVATIWRGGCIIRARFLDRIREAYGSDRQTVPSLMLQDYFRDAVLKAEPAWRRVVSLAVEHGVAVPAFSSSLSYYDGLAPRAAGPANLLQGLRDYFGAHTYRRLDKDGSFHTRWSQDGSEVKV